MTDYEKTPRPDYAALLNPPEPSTVERWEAAAWRGAGKTAALALALVTVGLALVLLWQFACAVGDVLGGAR